MKEDVLDRPTTAAVETIRLTVEKDHISFEKCEFEVSRSGQRGPALVRFELAGDSAGVDWVVVVPAGRILGRSQGQNDPRPEACLRLAFGEAQPQPLKVLQAPEKAYPLFVFGIKSDGTYITGRCPAAKAGTTKAMYMSSEAPREGTPTMIVRP